MSGVGKGVATSSIGKILQAKGLRVNPIKVDPYLNVDAGTMNPTEHGEVFVLESGLETDQDMGNYERFLEMDLTPDDYMTSGMVYKAVIDRERNLGYGGKFVEAIPHVTDEILKRFVKAAESNGSDVSLIEIGGTVGDYQNILFIEAARVLKLKDPESVMFILVSYLPVPSKIGEMKTRPTQNAVHQLNSYGVQPDMIIARSEGPLDEKRRQKISVWCNVPEKAVISSPDIDSIYDVAMNFEKAGVSKVIMEKLNLKAKKRKDGLRGWRNFVRKSKNGKTSLNVAVVGKYFDTGDFVLSDAYVSVIEAIKISSYAENARTKLTWINSKDYESGKRSVEELKKFDGVIVPGGFGEKGVEGIIQAIKFVRENGIPYLGLCYGMQLAVVEFARNVAKMRGAHTTEVEKSTKYPVIDIIEEQKKNLMEKNFGATMRLGAHPAIIKSATLAEAIYKSTKISERHRHRYEVNPKFISKLEENGLVFSASSPDKRLMEIAELPQEVHPFFIAVQFHPEFKARPLDPHPLFSAFTRASKERKKLMSNEVYYNSFLNTARVRS